MHLFMEKLSVKGEAFKKAFRSELRKQFKADPAQFQYEIGDLDGIASRIVGLLTIKATSTKGKALRVVCRKFGLRPNRKAIAAFITEKRGA